jgi:hypothetical protein
MRKKITHLYLARLAMLLLLMFAFFACNKGVPDDEGVNMPPYYNLDVTLLPTMPKTDKEDHGAGFLKFRQDPDTARIITLETWLYHLQPNHSYQLQRAADPIANGSCLSTAWLTLGKGLVAQAIVTDGKGNGHETLFRDVTAIARGSQFWIHFQIVDADTKATVLSSDCYQYTVR